MFTIAPHETIPATLAVRCWGKWDMPTALAFERAAAAARAALPCRPGGHCVLNDVRDLAAHSEEVMRLLGGMFDRREDGLGVALLVGVGDARAQGRQIAGDAPIGMFEDRSEAEAWLRARLAAAERRAA